MTKYDTLRNYLSASQGCVEMTFEEIGELVGGLRPSAYEWRQWWENHPGHVQVKAWMEAGRRIVAVDLPGQRARFA